MSQYPELDKYIADSIQNGKTIPQLESEMMSNGYSTQDITNILGPYKNQAVNQSVVSSNVSNKTPKLKNKKVLFITGAAILVVGAGLLLANIFLFNGGSKSIIELNVHPGEIVGIKTCLDLQNIDDNLNGHYKLLNDIDCSETRNWNDGTGFSPIGINSRDRFQGSLNGNGYAISNLYINLDEDNVGIFSEAGSSNIFNLNIENIDVTGKKYVGGLAGKFFGNIEKLFITGKLAGAHTIGGMVGSQSSGIISESLSKVEITGPQETGSGNRIGGLVGFQTSGANIQKSYSVVNINSKADNVGGLVGGQEGVGLPINFLPSISNSFSMGRVSGRSRVGGLVGSTAARITFSYSTTYVDALDFDGGLIGSETRAWISDSFWDVDSSGKADTGGGSVNAKGKTGVSSEEIKNRSTFKGWNFSNIWEIKEGETPPYIKSLPKPNFSNTGNLDEIQALIDFDRMCSNLGINYAFIEIVGTSGGFGLTSYGNLILNGKKVSDNVASYKLSGSNLAFIKRINGKNYLYFNGKLIDEMQESLSFIENIYSISNDLILFKNINEENKLLSINNLEKNLIDDNLQKIIQQTNTDLRYSGTLLEGGNYLMAFRDPEVKLDEYPIQPHTHIMYNGEYVGLVYQPEYSIREFWSDFVKLKGDNYAYQNSDAELIYNGENLGEVGDSFSNSFLMNEKNYLYKKASDEISQYNIFFNGNHVGVGRSLYLSDNSYGYSYHRTGTSIYPDQCFHKDGANVICVSKGFSGLTDTYFMSDKHVLTKSSSSRDTRYYFNNTLIKETEAYSSADATVGKEKIIASIDKGVFLDGQRIGCAYEGAFSNDRGGFTATVFPKNDKYNLADCRNIIFSYFLENDIPIHIILGKNESGLNWPRLETVDGELIGYLGYGGIKIENLKSEGAQFVFPKSEILEQLQNDKVLFYNIDGDIQINTTVIGSGKDPSMSVCE